jgi:hypothetical protein
MMCSTGLLIILKDNLGPCTSVVVDAYGIMDLVHIGKAFKS